MESDIIKISHLNKSFGEVKAVNDLSFRVKKGELFAFLGVNGAGKSTTISILCGLLKKDSGTVQVNGIETDKAGAQTKRMLGVVFQDSVLDKPLTVKENLMSRAALYGITGNAFDKRLQELVEILDFDELLNRPVGKLSGGQRRRIDIARALLHRPEILILDEPTTGLDPQTRQLIWNVIEKLQKTENMTVFLTTHYIYDDSKQNYGAPKITVELRKTGDVISERTVGTYMRQMGIRAQWSKPWTITTKDSDFSTELQNILAEQFNPDRPNAVWCSDITYIWTIDGFVYLTSIMDLFSRKIIAWTLSKTLEVSCVIDTINKAKARRNIDQPLIIHSDRGSQYVATEYKKVTENMQRSYSKKAFPWDNACIESFHSIIKREWLNRFKIHDYKQAYRLIFEYLEAFYNTKRIHSHCNYMSPNEFERLYERTHTEAELLAG